MTSSVAFPSPLDRAFGDHRSIRYFLHEPLAPGHLDLIIEAGRRAPTDAQGHMYSLIRITRPALREALAVLCNQQQHIRDCAEFFVVALDVHRLQKLIEHRSGDYAMRERIALIYGTADATLVAQNMVVAAELLGYGTCYIGAVQNNTDAIARLLQMPAGVLPLYGLCIGVSDPAQLPPRRDRIPRELCFFDDEYPGEFSPAALESAYRAMSPKRDWYESISRYFTAGGTMEHREPIMAAAWAQQALAPQPIDGEADGLSQ